MTDRELLELAAKAAGYDISHPWNAERMMMPNPEIGLCVPDVSTCWNPLADAGDALRLAVMLRFTVKIEDHEIEVFNWEECLVSVEVFNGGDYEATTRRAIVRAAAEIGRNMK